MNPSEEAPSRAPATLPQARRALRRGTAVVLPNPPPLTHVVTATTPIAVNEAKRRPSGQPVALWAHHRDTLDALTGLWDLASRHRTTVLRLLAEEHLTVLLPVRSPGTLPSWLEPAVKDGWMLLFGATLGNR
ncbi:hypothetical protein [Streptomyces showdoensis]|uniref:hypothetical protein n=1 Tax=Streptomyces showdoensis TaxID=68268 RepID=UPI0031EF7541